jgi:putative membrane protein
VVARLLIRWGSNVAALWVAARLLGGVSYGGRWQTLVVAGLVFALVNWVVRPLVIVLSLPLIVLTLGVALFFVNLFMLYLTDWLVGDFRVGGFWSAAAATLIVWVVNHLLGLGLRRAGVGRRRRW